MHTNDNTRVPSFEVVGLILGTIFFIGFWALILGIVITKLAEWLPWIAMGALLLWYAKSVKRSPAKGGSDEQK